jgi:hypothetical protein
LAKAEERKLSALSKKLSARSENPSYVLVRKNAVADPASYLL